MGTINPTRSPTNDTDCRAEAILKYESRHAGAVSAYSSY